MTPTLPGADIRGYYRALGITLPGWATMEASVRCFAEPEAHRRGDRDPSCSVNLEHGAWHCHGCGAKGGAFDAATARGFTDRAAVDLMAAHRLIEHRAHAGGSRRPARSQTRRRRVPSAQPVLKATEDDVAAWQAKLASDRVVIARLARERSWRYSVMRSLELGLDQGRITIPTRDHTGRLVGLLRYQPWPSPGEAKLRAASGSRRTLLPHPAAEPSQSILLVEGEPDMIAARSHGLSAIAVPGVEGWRAAWAPLFTNRAVIVLVDADPQGRALAARIADDLVEVSEVTVVDIAPERDDGYDLTDWLVDKPARAQFLRIEFGLRGNRQGDR